MDSEPPTSNSDRRSKLYDKMEQDLDEHGAVFLQGGETSQSLSLSDIFALRDGVVTPVHKAANPPVRANVLYLSPEFSVHISASFSHHSRLSRRSHLAPWLKVTSGTDPVTIRAKLRNALPRAPEKQLCDPAMLHTSFARLLGQPKIPSEDKHQESNQLQFFHELVTRLNNQIRGVRL